MVLFNGFAPKNGYFEQTTRKPGCRDDLAPHYTRGAILGGHTSTRACGNRFRGAQNTRETVASWQNFQEIFTAAR